LKSFYSLRFCLNRVWSSFIRFHSFKSAGAISERSISEQHATVRERLQTRMLKPQIYCDLRLNMASVRADTRWKMLRTRILTKLTKSNVMNAIRPLLVSGITIALRLHYDCIMIALRLHYDWLTTICCLILILIITTWWIIQPDKSFRNFTTLITQDCHFPRYPVFLLRSKFILSLHLRSGLGPSRFETNILYSFLYPPTHAASFVHRILRDVISLTLLTKLYKSWNIFLRNFLKILSLHLPKHFVLKQCSFYIVSLEVQLIHLPTHTKEEVKL
jgi:hypothetical protein